MTWNEDLWDARRPLTGRQILACAIVGALLAALSFGVAGWALIGLNAPFCVAWKWPVPAGLAPEGPRAPRAGIKQ